jgi:hypothetical protein
MTSSGTRLEETVFGRLACIGTLLLAALQSS